MTSVAAGKIVRLLTILAMVVQLGVVAWHHHPDEVLGASNAQAVGADVAHYASGAHAVHDHGHDHDAGESHHGDDHHHPIDGEPHDCDLCLVKTGVTGALLAQESVELWAAAPSKKRYSADRDTIFRDDISERYRARAPPLQATVS